MSQFIINIPDDKVEEVIIAICGDCEPTALVAKQTLLNWIKRKVLNERKKTAKQSVNVGDLGLSYENGGNPST